MARVNEGNSWEILKDAILRGTPGHAGSQATAIRGFVFHRQVNNHDPTPHFFEPVVIVVAQGTKLVRIGQEERQYGENICFVCGVDMPVSSCVMEASAEKPYLSLSLKLDTALIAELASKVPAAPVGPGHLRGAITQNLEADLLDSFVRLAELANKAEQIPVMEGLLLQEIHYRLLDGPFGGILRSLTTMVE